MRAPSRWPGSIFLLAGGQERHSAANLLPVAFHPREAQHIQCFSGSVGVAGAVLELAPAAILVLPGEESIVLFDPAGNWIEITDRCAV